PEALAVARAAGEAMGKVVIDAVDGPGFLVNRCNRPFGLEGQKLLQDGVATVEEIDRICRMGGGFRMGPVELSDLVGVDVGLDVTGGEEPEAPLEGGPQAICCSAGSLATMDPGGGAVGFHALPPLGDVQLVELTRGPDSTASAASAAERFFATLGKHTAWVGD